MCDSTRKKLTSLLMSHAATTASSTVLRLASGNAMLGRNVCGGTSVRCSEVLRAVALQLRRGLRRKESVQDDRWTPPCESLRPTI